MRSSLKGSQLSPTASVRASLLDQSPSSPLQEIDEAFAEQIEQDICEELTERTETIEEESALHEDVGSVYNENLISALEKKNKVAANVDPF
jgi:hypothetical protein